MAYSDTVKKVWRDNVLFSALLELTYRCNLDCFFCYNDRGAAGKPLSTRQYFELLEELRDLGTMNLTLTGGEPLAHRDFFALGARARELSFVVRIKSNGHALGPRMARRLKTEIDPFIVEVSLHGARAQSHDQQTRVPGSFERLMRNLEAMCDIGLRVHLNSALTAWNEEEISEMFTLADRLGLPLRFDPEVTPRDDGDRGPLAISASRKGLERLYDVLHARSAAVKRRQSQTCTEERDAKHCGAGSAGVAIDPYGNVYPCVQWRRPVGNLHTASITDIWSNATGLDDIRRLTVEARNMVNTYGADGPGLSFCPGAASMNTGSPVHVYPAALLRMELFKRTKNKSRRCDSQAV